MATNLARQVIQEAYGTSDEDLFVTFRHFRYIDEDLCDITARGGITFCVVAEPDSEKLHVSMALCSTKDLFNRDIGRKVSFGRFSNVGEYVTIDWDRELTIAENIQENWQLFDLGFHWMDTKLCSKNRYKF